MKGAKIGIYSVIKQSCLSIALLSSHRGISTCHTDLTSMTHLQLDNMCNSL